MPNDYGGYNTLDELWKAYLRGEVDLSMLNRILRGRGQAQGQGDPVGDPFAYADYGQQKPKPKPQQVIPGQSNSYVDPAEDYYNSVYGPNNPFTNRGPVRTAYTPDQLRAFTKRQESGETDRLTPYPEFIQRTTGANVRHRSAQDRRNASPTQQKFFERLLKQRGVDVDDFLKEERNATAAGPIMGAYNYGALPIRLRQQAGRVRR